MLTILIYLSFSYVLGSIPFGLIITFLVKKIDIRKFGSGNIGATNVSRVIGKKWGITVFVLDFLKGFAAPLIGQMLLTENPVSFYVAAAILSVCGHNWPVFLKFKGGKGVATSAGAVVGLSVVFSGLRLVIVFTLAIWAVIFFIFRYVSLASLLATISFVGLSFVPRFNIPLELKFLSVLLCVFIIIRHKNNIQRLLAKKEHKF